ncbi:MAG: hypothetical protein R3321_07055 [Nitrososphaeraceae archaeon]|nr:hypothetical protein [Nitrososphaeraceae archaeon]
MSELIRDAVIILGVIGLGYFMSELFNHGRNLAPSFNELNMSIEDVATDLKKDEASRIIRNPTLQEAFAKNIGKDEYGNHYIRQIGVTGEGDSNTPKQDYFIKVQSNIHHFL